MVELKKLTAWMDKYLEVNKWKDEDTSLNGLQVEAGHEVKRIALAVDACMDAFHKAHKREADLMIVHHGLYWKNADPLVKGYMSERVKYLLDQKISVYGCHLPLDVHPEVGNNVAILRAMGFKAKQRLGDVAWHCSPQKPFSEILKRIKESVGQPKHLLEFGEKMVNDLVVCSGAATEMVFEVPKGATVLMGELSHFGYHYAKERQLNVVAAGHYITEKFGVIALGNLIEQKFGVPSVFVDAPTGL